MNEKFSPEEILQLEESRTISDANLLQEGGEYVFDKDGSMRLKLGDPDTVDQANKNAETPEAKRVEDKIREIVLALYPQIQLHYSTQIEESSFNWIGKVDH